MKKFLKNTWFMKNEFLILFNLDLTKLPNQNNPLPSNPGIFFGLKMEHLSYSTHVWSIANFNFRHLLLEILQVLLVADQPKKGRSKNASKKLLKSTLCSLLSIIKVFVVPTDVNSNIVKLKSVMKHKTFLFEQL